MGRMESQLTDIDFGEVVHVARPASPSSVLVVCEHASNRVPDGLDGLGLSDAVLASHVAWDPGALPVARRMAQRLGAGLVSGGVSRLVYDCNRPPEADSAIAERSEVHDIPGNRGLSDMQRRQRVDRVYHAFHAALGAEIARQAETLALLVTVHSFTPVYHGRPRDVEIGILHGRDARFASAMMAQIPENPAFVTRLNEPYSAADGVAHTLDRQGAANGLPSVMIEVRNDLIQTRDAQERVADHLADWVSSTLDALTDGGVAG